MTPSFSVKNALNCLRGNIKPFSQFAKQLCSKTVSHICSVISDHKLNINFGKMGSAALRATRRTSFLGHILHIICMGAKKKMIWPSARWIIASMQYVQALRDWAIYILPNKTMNQICSFFLQPASPVTIWCSITRPNPTFTALIKERPEILSAIFSAISTFSGAESTASYLKSGCSYWKRLLASFANQEDACSRLRIIRRTDNLMTHAEVPFSLPRPRVLPAPLGLLRA